MIAREVGSDTPSTVARVACGAVVVVEDPLAALVPDVPVEEVGPGLLDESVTTATATTAATAPPAAVQPRNFRLLSV